LPAISQNRTCLLICWICPASVSQSSDRATRVSGHPPCFTIRSGTRSPMWRPLLVKWWEFSKQSNAATASSDVARFYTAFACRQEMATVLIATGAASVVAAPLMELLPSQIRLECAARDSRMRSTVNTKRRFAQSERGKASSWVSRGSARELCWTSVATSPGDKPS
jgi:hypothetical protein